MGELGWRRKTSCSDGEYSLCALKNAVRDAIPDVEMIPKESLVGDHTANVEAEIAVKEINRQVRVLKSSLEQTLKQHLLANHPLLTWLPRYGANCLTRSYRRRRQDGR